MPPASPDKVAGASSAVTCDQCRNRKVRCKPGPPVLALTANRSYTPCVNCTRRQQECTYDYTPKKPGRPRAPTVRKGSRASGTPTRSTTRPSPAPSTNDSPSSAPTAETTGTHVNPADTVLLPLSPGPTYGSIFGSARQTLQSLEFDYTLPRTRPVSPGPPSGRTPQSFGLDTSTPARQRPDANEPAWSLLPPPTSAPSQAPTYSPSTSMADLVAASEDALHSTGVNATDPIDISRIESFASWEDIGFFLSLHMKHQHMLVPLVHLPTFAQKVLMRRDETDEAFRGLLLSIVSYTIAQCPINWLMGRMEKPALEQLLARCQRGSRIIQIRHQTRPSLVVLASTMLDWITSQSASAAEMPANLMADVRRLIYTLGLNRENPQDGLSPVEVDLRRRMFWEAYAIDKTNSLNGHPINFHDMDGCPPLPEERDDEFHERSPDRLSYMVGFVAVSRLFKILSGCIVRQRTLVNNPDAAQDKDALLAYVERALAQVHAICVEMPDQLQPGNASDTNTVFGTQAANVYITALNIELALLDLRAMVVGEDDEHARHEIAQRAFRHLEHMPLECLASNGESLRGKVLRVILTLLNVGHDGTLGEGLWDWWNMYSRIQFIQLMPEVPMRS